MYLVRDENGEAVEAGKLDQEDLKALSDPIRRNIMKQLSSGESYPSEISDMLDIGKQQVYYHFEKLREAGLVEETREEKRSGGTATFYRASQKAYALDMGGEKDFDVPVTKEKVRRFLKPLINDGEFTGKIVVGSPDEHGEDQVSARDGHLAAELGLKLGNYCAPGNLDVVLDTKVFRSSSFDDSIILLGGVLTNTLTKKFNDAFPVHYPTESFPYHRIETPEDSYTDGSIGVVARAQNPVCSEQSIYLVSGIRSRGTKAAVQAFKQLEELVKQRENIGDGFYAVVRGLDTTGDGEIDSFEVIE